MGSNAANRDLSYEFMFTQCPNCKTLFRITQEQLDAVAGKVRCGFCYSTFTAYDALFEDLPDIETAENQEDIAHDEALIEPEESIEPEETVEPHVDVLDRELHEAAADHELLFPDEEPATTYEFELPPTSVPSAPSRPRPDDILARGEQTPPLSAPLPSPAALPAPALPARPVPRETFIPSLPGLRTPQAAPAPAPRPTAKPPSLASFFSSEPAPAIPPIIAPSVDEKPPTKTAPAVEHQPPPSTASGARQEPAMEQIPSLLDALDSAGRDLQQVHRFELDGLRRLRPGLDTASANTMGWAAATLLMVALMVGQYGYFMRGDLARFPQLRPYLEQMCGVLSCTLPLMRTPTLIRVVSRDIRAHPTEKGALLVRTRILNSAPYTQAFPVLRLDMSNVAGEVVASRHFRPEEYLNRAVDIGAGIPSRGQVDIELQIVDPSGGAAGFEMAFL